MNPSKLLLLSNSTNPGEEYLAYARQHIRDFLGNEIEKVLFIPYAAISISYDAYEKRTAQVFEALGYQLESIHHADRPGKAVSEAQALAVGGGNTFQLMRLIQAFDLADVIRKRAASGMPYIGWSAGSNIACPSIKTTNDMPVTELPSFNGLHLVPFQINPHYTEKTIPDHGGESRLQRIREFLMLHRDMKVAALPEGCIIKIINNALTLLGTEMKILAFGKKPKIIYSGETLQKDLSVL